MNVLLVGAGRMGARHLRGLAEVSVHTTVVDPRPEALADVAAAATFTSLDDALASADFGAAVLAETAAGRLERFRTLAEAGIRSVLLEKPLEQSRARTHALAAVAQEHSVDARVNHFYRTLDVFEELRGAGGPFRLSVTGGAFGVACNGIHWIDLASWLSGERGGELLYGELDETSIGSGRGPDFRDYGGLAVFGFDEGSRLYLDSAAESSAPMHVVITQPTRQTLVFPHEPRTVVAERDAASTLPAYRYGADYRVRDARAVQGDELWRSTMRWLEGGSHATVEQSVRSHDLLFDLLELSGEREFAIT